MPFPYYGAKHRLARFYPAPQHDTIIEPFAGAAGYSTYWAQQPRIRRVVLIDADPFVIGLWQRLQTMTAEQVTTAILDAATQQRTTEPLLAMNGGSSSIGRAHRDYAEAVTDRMRNDAPKLVRRICRVLPYLHKFQPMLGTYADAPDEQATWFIDPPYRVYDTLAGSLYVHGADSIDFDHLADWCRSRRGQVMVCEQHPADWLPFEPFRTSQNGAAESRSQRLEVLWHRCDRTPQQTGLFDEMA